MKALPEYYPRHWRIFESWQTKNKTAGFEKLSVGPSIINQRDYYQEKWKEHFGDGLKSESQELYKERAKLWGCDAGL